MGKFFKNPSFKYENLLVPYCPMCGYGKQVPSLLNFFAYSSTLDEHCENEIQEVLAIRGFEFRGFAFRGFLESFNALYFAV